MPISKNFIMKKLGDEYMIIPLNGTSVNMTKTFNINETAAHIYMGLENNKSIEEITNSMVEEYDVKREEAKADIIEFVNILKNKGIYYEQ